MNLELVIDRETGALKGYAWEAHRVPEPNRCLVYREEAIDVKLGIDLTIPESIQRDLEAGG